MDMLKRRGGCCQTVLKADRKAARHMFAAGYMSSISPRPCKLRRVLLTSLLRYPSMPTVVRNRFEETIPIEEEGVSCGDYLAIAWAWRWPWADLLAWHGHSSRTARRPWSCVCRQSASAPSARSASD